MSMIFLSSHGCVVEAADWARVDEHVDSFAKFKRVEVPRDGEERFPPANMGMIVVRIRLKVMGFLQQVLDLTLADAEKIMNSLAGLTPEFFGR